MTDLHRVDLNGKAAIDLEVHRGQVVGAKKWSETRVHSSGTRSWVGPQGGYVQPPSVSSSVRTRNEIWIRDHGSGQEYAISMDGDHIQYREGQEVAVFVGKLGQRRETLEVFNLATQKYNAFESKIAFLAKDAVNSGSASGGGMSVVIASALAVAAFGAVTYLAMTLRETFGSIPLLNFYAAALVFVGTVVASAMNRSSRDANRTAAASQRVHHALAGLRSRVNVEAGVHRE